jgi:nitroreductase
MSFIELAKRRYSSRSYKNQPVEEEKLMQVLDAARIAPTAANKQPVRIVVVRDHETRKKFITVYPRQWIVDAPVILAIVCDHNHSWKRSFDNKDICDVDAAIIADHLTLAATDLGLATCWICAFNPTICREILNLPDHIEPVVLLPLGYPADKVDLERHSKMRKPLSEILHWERYQ